MPVNYIFICTSFLPQFEISKYVILSVTSFIVHAVTASVWTGWMGSTPDRQAPSSCVHGQSWRSPLQTAFSRTLAAKATTGEETAASRSEGRERGQVSQTGKTRVCGRERGCAAAVRKPGNPALRLSSVVPARGTLHYRGPSSHPRCSHVITFILIDSVSLPLWISTVFSHVESPLPTMTLERKLQPLLFYWEGKCTPEMTIICPRSWCSWVDPGLEVQRLCISQDPVLCSVCCQHRGNPIMEPSHCTPGNVLATPGFPWQTARQGAFYIKNSPDLSIALW